MGERYGMELYFRKVVLKKLVGLKVATRRSIISEGQSGK